MDEMVRTVWFWLEDDGRSDVVVQLRSEHNPDALLTEGATRGVRRDVESLCV